MYLSQVQRIDRIYNIRENVQVGRIPENKIP